MDEDTIYDGLNTNKKPDGVISKRRRILISNLSDAQKANIRNGGFATGGLFIGGSASAMFNSKFKNSQDAVTEFNPEDDKTNENDDIVAIYVNVNFSDKVTDDMTFNKAFATARGEVGPGGFFEWNGNVYNTFYKEEWDNLTESQQQDYWSTIESSAEYDTLQLTNKNEITENESEQNIWEEDKIESENQDSGNINEINQDQSKPIKPDIDLIQEETQTNINKPVIGIADLNKDNIPEAVAEDYDNDGFADVVAIDKDNDGALDQLMIDTDGDYDLDIIIIDSDNDGFENDQSIALEEPLEINMDDFIIVNDHDLSDNEEIQEDLPEMDDDADVDDLI